jgi:hypothetical protein
MLGPSSILSISSQNDANFSNVPREKAATRGGQRGSLYLSVSFDESTRFLPTQHGDGQRQVRNGSSLAVQVKRHILVACFSYSCDSGVWRVRYTNPFIIGKLSPRALD